MNCGSRIIRLGQVVALFALFAATGISQKDSDKWLRVVTGEDSVIDVDKTSLAIEPNQLIQADFRTVLSKNEPIPEKPGTKYSTRLNTIEFDLKDGRYRVLKSTLSDSSGALLLSSQSHDTSKWRSASDGTANRLYSVAEQLAPFGSWAVRSYRYPSGETPQNDDPKELTALVGEDISLRLRYVQVSDKVCQTPVFDPLTITSGEFQKRFGTPLTALGLKTDKINALMLSCKTVNTYDITYDIPAEPEGAPRLKAKGVRPQTKQVVVVKQADPAKFPEQTLILLLDDRPALMLWDGVFLEIERQANSILPK